MKIIATILISSLLFVHCASTEVIEPTFAPTKTKGCVNQSSTSARLKCISNLVRAYQDRSNVTVETEVIEGNRLDWKRVEVTYNYCFVHIKTKEVYDCIEHKTSKDKPSLTYEITSVAIKVGFFVAGVFVGKVI